MALTGACRDPDDEPGWSVAFEGLDGALLSVWGTAADDVWTVGADPGDGPYILHWDGAAWQRIASPARGDLWWVTVGPDDTVYMAGDGGLVLRLPTGASEPEIISTPSSERLFGVYAFAPDDVWAVGGDAEQQSGVVWRYDGSAWTELEVPSEAAGVTFFKVWGSSADDVWIVGLGGTALHYDGTVLAPVAVPQGRPLFTVHGNGDDVVAVGGFASGLIAEVEAEALIDATPTTGEVPQFNGCYVTADEAWAAGVFGAIWRRDNGVWTADEDVPSMPRDYHSIYVDPEGGVWAVGGDIVAPPLRNGVLTHRGEPVEGGWNG